MKNIKIISVLLVLLLITVLCSCAVKAPEPEVSYDVVIFDSGSEAEPVPPAPSEAPLPENEPDPAPSPVITPEPVPEKEPEPVVYPEVSIGPVSSHFELDGQNIDDIIRSFCEAVLGEEYLTNSDAAVYKWKAPMVCYIMTDSTEDDAAAIESAVDILNSVEGFPGVSVTEWTPNANCYIYFYDRFTFNSVIGKKIGYEEADGAFQIFIDKEGAITQAHVYIRSDTDSKVRAGVIAEQLIRSSGITGSTGTRRDSIVYSGFSYARSVSAEDELILKLLYCSDIKPGMDYGHCAAVIKALYE